MIAGAAGTADTAMLSTGAYWSGSPPSSDASATIFGVSAGAITDSLGAASNQATISAGIIDSSWAAP